ncbi:hypothetical protein [Bdellovibrio sp. HCB337]|uniref:hypothetical protein n=1 Tax=Bdellovibrio sp. HCB337 TaxID=3394358 RepID=UPI0039A64664
MRFQGLIYIIATLAMVGCAHSKVQQTETTAQINAATVVTQPEVVVPLATVAEAPVVPVKKADNNGFLICKAKKNKFFYDWNASSLLSGENNQNTVRFEFRSAKRPAGEKGENLKAGECGWAEEALAGNKKAKSQVTFKSLSDEVTHNFYKLKTGKVFKVPVRQTQNGMMAAPGTGVSVVR